MPVEKGVFSMISAIDFYHGDEHLINCNDSDCYCANCFDINDYYDENEE